MEAASGKTESFSKRPYRKKSQREEFFSLREDGFPLLSVGTGAILLRRKIHHLSATLQVMSNRHLQSYWSLMKNPSDRKVLEQAQELGLGLVVKA